MKFKPKMIEAIPYEVLEYLESKPNSFNKIIGEQYELLNTATKEDEKVYNYFFINKDKKYEETILKIIKGVK